jgi:hypothetical protein
MSGFFFGGGRGSELNLIHYAENVGHHCTKFNLLRLVDPCCMYCDVRSDGKVDRGTGNTGQDIK